MLSSVVQFGCGTNPFAGLLLMRPRAACGMRKEGIRDENVSKTSGHRCYGRNAADGRSEENTSELQSLMRISYAGFCLKKTKQNRTIMSSVPDTSDLTTLSLKNSYP